MNLDYFWLLHDNYIYLKNIEVLRNTLKKKGMKAENLSNYTIYEK